MKRRVVVTGVGAVCSLALKTDELFRRLLAGESGIHTLQVFDTSAHKVTFGGDIYDWNPTGYIDAKEQKRIDRFTQLAMVSAIDAVADSGLDFDRENRDRCGTIVGSGVGGLNEIEDQMRRLLEKGPDRVSAFTIPKLIVNAASGHVAIHFGLRGVNYAVATACASATNAIGDAFHLIRNGQIDIAVTGGSEAACTPMGVAGFSNMKALSERNDSPQAASRPFDIDRDGFVLSEGAGIVVLEEYEHAQARGAKIYGEVLGYGATCDGGHITQPDPEGAGAARAMAMALADGGLSPDKIDYINAHGTSTPLGDKAETIAIKRVYGDHAYKLNVSSTKSQLGHLLGASGGIEFVICMHALQQQVCPPTINLDNPDPACDLNYTPHQPCEREIRAVMSNSFGFGGHNGSLVMGRV